MTLPSSIGFFCPFFRAVVIAQFWSMMLSIGQTGADDQTHTGDSHTLVDLSSDH